MNAVGAVGCVVVGLGAGSLHFGLLRWSVRVYARRVPVRMSALETGPVRNSVCGA
jgi:hypothetical protein